MAVSKQEILDFLNANPNMSDADIAKAMSQYVVSTAQMADATGLPESEVATRFLTQQILGQNTTSKWSGEGYGGAEANAKAMAKLLADAGITDIKQFGKVDKYEPVEVTGYTLNGKPVQNPSAGVFYEQIPQYDYEGGIQGYQARYLSPQEAAQVQPQYGIVEADADGGQVVTPVTNVVEKNGQLLGVTGQTFGNKETGEAIESGTGRWQKQGGEDLFSGTGEGKGNTAFRAQFDAQGNPIFYTTQGTSNDLANIMNDYGPIGSIAANYLAMQFGGPAGVAALNAAQGKDFEEVAKATLLAYAGGEISKGLDGGAVLGDASDIAMEMADAGATLPEIETALINKGFSSSVVADSLKDAANVLTPTATNIPSSVPSLLDTVSVVAPSTVPTLSNLLGAASVIPTITPTQVTPPVITPTVEQTITSNRPETVTDVINSIAATVPTTPDVTQVSTTPEQVITSQKPITTVQDVVNTITSVIPTITPSVAETIAEQVVTSNKPVTTQEVVNAITATLPTAVTPTVTTPAVEEQVVTAQKPVTTQDVINAITSTIPTAPTVTIPTEPVVTPEQVITAEKPITNQQIIDAITSVIPSTPTPVIPTEPVVPEQVITNNRPVTNEDIVSTIVSNIPTSVTTTPEVSVTAEKPITIQDVINAVTNLVPTTPVVTPPVVTPEQVITAEKPVTTNDVVNSIVSTIPTTSVVTPEQVITAQKPVTTQDVINSIIASIPTTPVTTPEVTVTAPSTPKLSDVINSIIASVPTTPVVPEQTIIAQKPVTTQDIVNAIVATVPTTTAVTTPTIAEQTITAQKPSNITDVVTAATIPLSQPSTPSIPKQVTAEKELSNSDKIRLAQIGIGAAGLLGVGAAASGSGANQYPIVPVPESWTSPLPTSVAPYTPLTPINFGDRNLLTGTQWEKFLSPNYGKVPEPVKYSAPSNMSYSDLMSILGNKQSPRGANLTISDIISGIQNQYG